MQDQPRDEHELAAGQWRAAADPATVARVAVPGHRSVQQNLLIWRKIKKGCFSKVSESELYMLLKAKKPQAVCIHRETLQSWHTVHLSTILGRRYTTRRAAKAGGAQPLPGLQFVPHLRAHPDAERGRGDALPLRPHPQEQREGALRGPPQGGRHLHQERVPRRRRRPLPAHQGHRRNPHHYDRIQRCVQMLRMSTITFLGVDRIGV